MSSSYNYKLFRVKRNGKTTTVSLDPALVIRACKKFGVHQVDNLVQQAALEFTPVPGMASCSGYVAHRLQMALAAGVLQPA